MSVALKSKKLSLITLVLVFLMILMVIAVLSMTKPAPLAYADPISGFSVSDAVVGSGQAEFTIERGDASKAESISYRTMSGTAIAGTHFIAISGILNFDIEEYSKTVTVDVTSANEQYDTYLTTKYTNIDRTFYLQIYNASEGSSISNNTGAATLSTLGTFNVDSAFFNDSTFYNFNGIFNLMSGNAFSAPITSPGEYYEVVGQSYAFKIDFSINNYSDQLIIMGLASIPGFNIPTFDFELEPGDSDYIIAMISLSANSFSLPYLNGSGQLLTDFADVGSITIVEQNLYNGITVIENEYIGMPTKDNYVFMIPEEGSLPYNINSINVFGKVVDNQAPLMLGASQFEGSYRTGDTVYISLVFDEIIGGGTITSIATNSGDFNYVYGIGSNVLVFEGVIGSSVTDGIEITGINGTVQDYSGNPYAFSGATIPISVQKVTPTWQDNDRVASSFSGGEGSVSNPYQISNGQQLAYLARLTNEGNALYNDKYYILTSDIDLALEYDKLLWVAIGNDINPFKGGFDGNGYKISGMTLDLSEITSTLYGLFGKTDGAVIKNVGLTQTSIEGEALNPCYIGGLAAYANGSFFINVYVDDFSCVTKMNGGNFGVMLGYGNNVTIENFYIINFYPTFYEEGYFDYFNIICAQYVGDYTLAVGYSNTTIYYSSENIVSGADLSTLHADLYDYAIQYSINQFKNGRDLRLYKWVAGNDNYPILEKVALLSEITLSMSSPEANLGQNTVKTFSEAVVGLARDGVIIIAEAYTIDSIQEWTLPKTVFNNAYVTSTDTFSGDAVVIANQPLILQDIIIVNNTQSSAFFKNNNGIFIGRGTVIDGFSIYNSGNMAIEDDETDNISIGLIYSADNSHISLLAPLYSSITIEIGPDYITNTGHTLIVAGDEFDAGLYIDKVSVLGSYALVSEEDVIKVYQKRSFIYFDSTVIECGTGSMSSPIKNLQKVKDIAEVAAVVYIMGTISITESTIWDLDGYNMTFTKYQPGTLFQVSNNSTLTLKNIKINALDNVAVSIGNGSSLITDNLELEAAYNSEYSIVVNSGAYFELDGISTIQSCILLCVEGLEHARITLSGAPTENYKIKIPNEWGNDNVLVGFKEEGLNIADYESNFDLQSEGDAYYLYTDTENNTLVANMLRFTATLYFFDGGSVYEEQIINMSGFVVEPEIFRLGYKIVCWKNSDTHEEFDFATPITDDISLYACWENYFFSVEALGTEESPFLISNYEHLKNVSYLFSEDNIYYDTYKNKYYKLNNHIIIDYEAEEFVPIGSVTKPFEGTFDGNGYIIESLRINQTHAAFIYLNKGTITSLAISGDIIGSEYAAAFAIYNEGLITKCINGANIIATDYDSFVAGISIMNFDAYKYSEEDEEFPYELLLHGTISDCINLGYLEAEFGAAAGISLLFGYIQNCFNYAAFNGLPITFIAMSADNCFYSSELFSYYEDEFGQGIRSIEMLGENSSDHTNTLFNALYAANSADWILNANEGSYWYLPQLAVFAEIPIGGNVYKITYQYDDGVTPDYIEYQVDNVEVNRPEEEPIKPLNLFNGWYLFEDGEITEEFSFTYISNDIVLKATWVTFRLIYSDGEIGLVIEGIQIGEGVENLEVTISSEVEGIAELAFANKHNISSIVFDMDIDLRYIGKEAFKGTGITTIILPTVASGINFQSFLGANLESVFVYKSGYYSSYDGILYADNDSILVYYPYAKTDSQYILPQSVQHIEDYAFIGLEENYNYYGNPYLTQLTLNDNLTSVGDKGLYGLSSLQKIIIDADTPAFLANGEMFSYYNGESDCINPNLIIELSSYETYTNFMTNYDWFIFSGYFRYPLVITFDYQGATGNNTETIRTTVNGEINGDLIFNGMSLGTLPQPFKFGYELLEWNLAAMGNGSTVNHDTLLYSNYTIYAIWYEWTEITISYNEITEETLVNGVNYNTSLNDIINVDSVNKVNFDNAHTNEQIILNNKNITFTGVLYSYYEGAAVLLETNSDVTSTMSVMVNQIAYYVPAGTETPNKLNYNSYTFVQSPTSDITVYNERATASLPNEEHNIIYWDELGLIGRNQTELYFVDIPQGQNYSPIARYTLTIIDSTPDYIFNNQYRTVTYTTNRDDTFGKMDCDVIYFASEEDMINRQNAMNNAPVNAGTYYYVISRKNYNDVCDAEDVLGSYTIDKATVIVEAISQVSINKVFDGGNVYSGALENGNHFTVSGIVNSAQVIIESIIYNDINVVLASYATVYVSISDSNNYTINESFVISATISALEVNVVWDYQPNYFYTANNQADTVRAKFVDVNNSDRFLSASFSGYSTQFINAGTYTATASNTDTNYSLVSDTDSINITINKAVVVVSSKENVTLFKTYDGNMNYTLPILKDEHYIVSGIVDSAFVTITSKLFNSADVDSADTITALIQISDNDNYTVNASFDIDAYINPLEVEYTWDYPISIVYNGSDQSDEIKAYFSKVDSETYNADITFSGKDTEFKDAGNYVASASFTDSNYAFTNTAVNLYINKAQIAVEAIEVASISKTYDGATDYYGSLAKDTHYSITGVVDDAEVIISGIQFNSSEVRLTTYATVFIAISDADNYTINESFDISGEIVPLQVSAVWDYLTDYVYDTTNQGNTVSATFTNINLLHVPLEIAFSGHSNIFMTAGTYTATASTDNSNYALTENEIELTIARAATIITAEEVQEHTYDGAFKKVIASLNHNETVLPDQGRIETGNYEITINAPQTDNYESATKVITLKIVKAEFTTIEHNEINIIYLPGKKLEDLTLESDFYWTDGSILIFAGDGQQFDAYYNADIDNYENYYLTITVNVDKATPSVSDYPDTTPLVAGRELSFSAISNGNANVGGYFVWQNGDDIIYDAGIHQRPARFIPDDADNYYSIIIDINIEIVYLEVWFISYNTSELVEVCYNGTVLQQDFPVAGDRAGYSKGWELENDITGIKEDMEVNAVYTLLSPNLSILGYDGEVVYGVTVTLQAYPTHDLATIIYSSYSWYYNDALFSASNYVSITEVAQSGSYKVVVEATDGEQTKFTEATVEVIINKAQAVITADSVQIHTYDGSVKNVHATLNHNETILDYEDQQGYTLAREEGYTITVFAEETDNYLAASVEVLLIINRANIDFSGITFNDITRVYDKQPHSVFIEGLLPAEIISVDYINNTITNVGSVTVTAVFSYDEINYNIAQPIQATITITPRPVYIEIDNKTSVYGQPLEMLTCTVSNNITGDDLRLILTRENNNNAGDYVITATIDNDNYQPVITNGTYAITKAVIDMVNVTFNDKTVNYNAESQVLTLTGVLPSEIQNVNYTNNGGRNAGTYNATASFVYDEVNYQAIAPMTATLTILPKELTITFHQPENVYFDGTVKRITVSINGIPDAETDTIVPVITYNKTVVRPDYYTATVVLNNSNYILVGEKTYDFIIYWKEVHNEKEEEVDVIAIFSKGFLPGTTINVKNVKERQLLQSELFDGKEKKQTFEIEIEGDTLGDNDYITMKILIDSEFRFLQNLRIAKIDSSGNLQEIECEREGDYLKFNVTDTKGTYIIIGDGKGNINWVIPTVAGGIALIGLVVLVIILLSRKKKKTRTQVIGQ